MVCVNFVVSCYAGALLAEAKTGTTLTEGGLVLILQGQRGPLPIPPCPGRPTHVLQGPGTDQKVLSLTIMRKRQVLLKR